MKLAVIAPPHALSALKDLRSGYHLALAQHLSSPGETRGQYDQYFDQARYHGEFIIVDNGVAEGQAIEFWRVVQRANLIGADEIVMPDTIRDRDATLAACSSDLVLSLVEPHRRLFVPQGRSIEEWMLCLREAEHRFKFATIGVPKHMEDFGNGRMELLARLHIEGYDRSHNIHMLGCRRMPIHEVQRAQASLCYVRGIDTGAPVAYAQVGRHIFDAAHVSLEWDMFIRPEDEEQFGFLMRRNIQNLRDYCAEM